MVIKNDGLLSIASPDLLREWPMTGSKKEAPKVLPRVHTLIANIKGNIHGIHHIVRPNPLYS